MGTNMAMESMHSAPKEKINKMLFICMKGSSVMMRSKAWRWSGMEKLYILGSLEITFTFLKQNQLCFTRMVIYI
jgi:hypothetical protein